MLGWNHYFGKKNMTKLNIFLLNGVWQLGRPQQDDEEDDEEDHCHNNMLKVINLSQQSPIKPNC